MDLGAASVVAAAITAVGAVLATLAQLGRHENRVDHNEVRDELRSLRTTVERVETKHDRHIEGHLTGKINGIVQKRSRKRTTK